MYTFQENSTRENDTEPTRLTPRQLSRRRLVLLTTFMSNV